MKEIQQAQARHIVWVTLDAELFSTRYGFGEKSNLGHLLHSFIINILENVKLSSDETERRADYRPVQMGIYLECHNGETRRYHVSENIAQIFYGLHTRLRKQVYDFAQEKEGIGKNILIQMLKSDILGEATS